MLEEAWPDSDESVARAELQSGWHWRKACCSEDYMPMCGGCSERRKAGTLAAEVAAGSSEGAPSG